MPRPCSRAPLALGLLVFVFVLALGAGASGESSGPGEPVRVRLRTASEDVARRLEADGWIRWISRRGDLDVSVDVGGPGDGDSAESGETLVDVSLGGTLDGLEDPPVRIRPEGVRVGGRWHEGDDLALATRHPAPDSLRWAVVGRDVSTVLRATARLLVRLGGAGEDWDVLVLSPEQLEHRARIVAVGDSYRIDSRTEVDQLAERDAHYGGMDVRRRGGLLIRGAPEVLGDGRIAAALERLPPRLAGWADQLAVELEAPVEVILESDHEAQGRHRGLLGPTVDRGGRLHWVPGPDEWQLDWGVARALIDRAGLARDRPWLADGAALWLTRRWWGWPLERWRDPIVWSGLVSTADELSERERSADASTIFRTAVAALLIDEHTGEEDLAAALERLGSPGAIERGLAAWAGRVSEDGGTGLRPRSGLELPFLRGLSLAMANGLEIGYHSRALDPRLERLRELGANAVSIMPFAYQPRPDRPELRFLNRRPSSETDIGSVHAARRARDAGIFVLWKPHVWVSHDSWPGEIEMADEEAWRVWWRLYRRYILHHAVLAREAGAEILCLGVELGRTTGHGREWAELARAARRFFPGLLTYAGNWHGDYDRFPAWEELDLVGVDAYFPLGEPDAGREELIAGARRLADRLAADAERLGRPILLTEVGFAARRHAWVEPHREGGELSVADQALAWEALLEGLGRPDWLAGLFAWKVFSADLGSPGDAPDFRILDRPAEAELGRYFRAAAQR